MATLHVCISSIILTITARVEMQFVPSLHGDMNSQTSVRDMHEGHGAWEAQYFDPINGQDNNDGVGTWEAQYFDPISTGRHHQTSTQDIYNGLGALLQKLQSTLTAHEPKHVISNHNAQPWVPKNKWDCSDPTIECSRGTECVTASSLTSHHRSLCPRDYSCSCICKRGCRAENQFISPGLEILQGGTCRICHDNGRVENIRSRKKCRRLRKRMSNVTIAGEKK